MLFFFYLNIFPFISNYVNVFYFHEIAINLYLVYPWQKIAVTSMSIQGIALEKKNHVKCAVYNCDSCPRKCQYKNNSINFMND